jgi:hypothetical protein
MPKGSIWFQDSFAVRVLSIVAALPRSGDTSRRTASGRFHPTIRRG